MVQYDHSPGRINWFWLHGTILSNYILLIVLISHWSSLASVNPSNYNWNQVPALSTYQYSEFFASTDGGTTIFCSTANYWDSLTTVVGYIWMRPFKFCLNSYCKFILNSAALISCYSTVWKGTSFFQSHRQKADFQLPECTDIMVYCIVNITNLSYMALNICLDPVCKGFQTLVTWRSAIRTRSRLFELAQVLLNEGWFSYRWPVLSLFILTGVVTVLLSNWVSLKCWCLSDIKLAALI